MIMPPQYLRERDVHIKEYDGGKPCEMTRENMVQYRICEKDKHIEECPRKKILLIFRNF